MPAPDALIGHSGFVGGNLQRQHRFDAQFRSTDIAAIEGCTFDTVVCAGAPARKWIANREPEADRTNIQRLIGHLGSLACRRFVLISTVDVFARPVAVDETSPVERGGLHPYGLHRLELEDHVRERFPRSLVMRLPGVVGPGLSKNVLYDLKNSNALEAIDSRAVYQFYPITRLWRDIEIALDASLRLVHLAAEPMSVAEIARTAFGIELAATHGGEHARYDMRSLHARSFGGGDAYQCDRHESLEAIRLYATTEPRRA